MKTFIIAPALLALAAVPAHVACADKAARATSAQSEISTIFAGNYSKDKADIVETADAAGFTTLLAAAEAAGLVDALKGDGPLTVFAPTDEAFAALGEDTINMLLMPENKDKLAGVLKYHVVSGKVKSGDLAGKELSAETLNGTVEIDGTDGVMVNNATVITADVEASNGIIHVIDKVLMPAT
ncbi:MAG: fasciclin [Ponticaulis sp.]|nr:fasciclin [Ponticaulis sp.]|tara:strand:+ start:39109 stop:39657 length:549 start_codon:yes stop_codon:yes gene_type:complete